MTIADKPTKPLAPEAWEKLEEVIERFEEAWQEGPPPAIEDYLKSSAFAGHRLVLELVHADLECRLKAGEAIRVENYLARYPQLTDHVDEVLGLIAAEYNFRQRKEPHLTLSEYQQRFPQYGEQLLARLQPLRPREYLPSHLSCPHCHKAIPLTESAGEKQLTCSWCGGSFRFDLAHAPAWSPQALPRLGQYELLKEIGQGAFGTVYRARDADLGRVVAVKVPRLGRWVTPADHDRFVREARNVAQLAHPGIVPVYDVGRGAAVPYLVSAYIEGTTLAKVLSSRRLGFREAADLIAQVAEALDHAHGHGVIHRDLKPSNIMLGHVEGTASGLQPADEELPTSAGRTTGGMQAFVMDFGLSRKEEGEITVTLEGQVLGTPAYMSPEQARGEGHRVDGRSDVYSLGVILYELLTGEIPFRGVTRMVLHQIQFEEPRPPRRLNDKIPRDLETITLRCMAKEPSRRYATAGELAADLHRQLRGEPVQARPVGRLERSWRWSKRNPRTAALLGLIGALLVTMVIGTLFYFRDIRRERDTADRQLELALETLKTTVYTVGEELRDRPGMHKLLKSLLDPALARLEELLPTARATDASVYLQGVHQRLGDLFFEQGQLSEARQHYEKLMALTEALALHHPERSGTQLRLALAYTRLVRINSLLGEVAACWRDCRKDLALTQALSEAAPEDRTVRLHLGECYAHLGGLSADEGDLPTAVRELHRARQVFQELQATAPEDRDAPHLLVRTLGRISDVLFAQGKYAEAQEYAEEALKQSTAFVALHPDSRALATDQVYVEHRLGFLHYAMAQFPQALAQSTQAVQRGEQLSATNALDILVKIELLQAHLVRSDASAALGNLAAAQEDARKALKLAQEWAADPSNLRARAEVIDIYRRLAEHEGEVHHYQEAATWFEKCRAALQALQDEGKLEPPLVQPALLTAVQRCLTLCRLSERVLHDHDLNFILAQPPEFAADLLVLRGTALAQQGEHASAAALADRVRAYHLKEGRHAYDAACLYGLAASALGRSRPVEQLTSEERATRRRYITRALEMLTEALDQGYKNLVRMETDPDLVDVRPEPTYRTLRARLRPDKKNP